jgi:hypothetical protein
MPFSNQLESQYKWLMRDKLNAVTFANPEEMDQFFLALNCVINTVEKKQLKDGKHEKDNKGHAGSSSKKFLVIQNYERVLQEFKSVMGFKHTNKVADIKEFKEMIEEGFDSYATDGIVDQVTQTRVGNDFKSAYIDVAAFVSIHAGKKDFKMTAQDKIKEARAEFERIVIEEIKNKISQVNQMTLAQKQQFISEKNKSRQEVLATQQKLKDSKEPAPESRTMTEEEWAAHHLAIFNAQLESYNQMQAELQRNQNPDAADFSHADLRGVNFTGVLLHGVRGFAENANAIDDEVGSPRYGNDGRLIVRAAAPQVLFQNIPADVKALSAETGINANELKQMQDNKIEDYEKVSNLLVYLKNANEGREPALSRQQVLATTSQECKNLKSVYQLIELELLTMDKAKQLSEDDRLTICTHLPRANDVEDLRNIVYALNAFQAAMNLS